MLRFQPILRSIVRKLNPRLLLVAGLIIGYIVICLLINAVDVHSQQMAPLSDEKIDAKMQSVIINSVTLALDSNYVYPDKAKKMGKYVRDKFKKGEYKDFTSVMQFTGKLTEDLLEVCKDKHSRVGYFPEVPFGLKDADSMS